MTLLNISTMWNPLWIGGNHPSKLPSLCTSRASSSNTLALRYYVFLARKNKLCPKHKKNRTKFELLVTWLAGNSCTVLQNTLEHDDDIHKRGRIVGRGGLFRASLDLHCLRHLRLPTRKHTSLTSSWHDSWNVIFSFPAKNSFICACWCYIFLVHRHCRFTS